MFSSDRKDAVSAQFDDVESLLQPDYIIKCKQGCLYFLFFPPADHESGVAKTLCIDVLKVNWGARFFSIGIKASLTSVLHVDLAHSLLRVSYELLTDDTKCHSVNKHTPINQSCTASENIATLRVVQLI